ncbi:MAG TPA: hypothetical protein VNJ12_08230 [Candidatus Dormibacteraeota bacterium]|nr:hypothetical protein [Candidatus Dormibacteraeota bacterium]
MEELNYFNYFTEVEEYFWRKRGAHVLVSPLDWAIVETWQKAGIPIEAVLKGIDRAFESYERSRRAQSGRGLKSLVYCVDAVLDAAQEAREAAAGRGPAGGATQHADSFSPEIIAGYFEGLIEQLRRAAAQARNSQPELANRFQQTAERLDERRAAFSQAGVGDTEDLERWLTVLEEKLTASITAAAPESVMLETRRELDRVLSPYRRKMTAEQLGLLERQYMQKRLFERFGVPRLSLFYLT